MKRTNQLCALVLSALACCTLPVACDSQPRTGIDDAVPDAAQLQDAEKIMQPTVDATVDANATVDASAMTKDAPKVEVVPISIGSPAPKLDIAHWIQDGEGQFSKVSEFEPDKVYVVEFWATWCGPCIASMPHIAAVQQSYADRGVQVISITRENVETVEKFLDREIAGKGSDDQPQTYRDLTSVYCLTADPDGSTSRDYMQAASRNGIPCAFIVGKDAKIEWIGHPMSMDEPLEEIVNDHWDRVAFATEYQAEQKVSEILSQVSVKMRRKDTKEAIAILDDVINGEDLESQKPRLRTIKFKILAADKSLADETAEFAVQLLADESIDASSVNEIAWTIYQLSQSGQLENEEVLKAALVASQKAAQSAGPGQAYVLDTAAHLQYALGDVTGAYKTQQAAMQAADIGQRRRLTDFLEQLENEVNADQEPPQDEASEETDKSEPAEDPSE